MGDEAENMSNPEAVVQEETLRTLKRDAYFWLVMVATVILGAGSSMLVSTEVNKRSVERERTARVASEQALCQVYVILDNVYAKTPPTTEAGRDLAAAIANARVVNHCPPRTGE